MVIRKHLFIIICIVTSMFICNIFNISVYAGASDDVYVTEDYVKIIEFIYNHSQEDIISINCATRAYNSVVLFKKINSKSLNDDVKELVDKTIEREEEIVFYGDLYNIDGIANYLMIETLYDSWISDSLISWQNSDGGFGLSHGYASDIIDTKLAMKALADVGETEAMNKAAKYIASLQNDDGGFSYQQGLESDPGLSAEIADVYGDCIIADQ